MKFDVKKKSYEFANEFMKNAERFGNLCYMIENHEKEFGPYSELMEDLKKYRNDLVIELDSLALYFHTMNKMVKAGTTEAKLFEIADKMVKCHFNHFELEE